MKLTTFLPFLLIGLLFACEEKNHIEASSREVQKGVSLELVKNRKNKIFNIRYVLTFDIPENKKEQIKAELSLSFSLSDATEPIVLDFKEKKEHVSKISNNDGSVPYSFLDEHLIIATKYLKAGENEFKISFIAGDLSLNRNDDFLYTLLVPDRARTLFPVFDQPNLKAVYKLTLNVPKNWEAIANGKALCETIENDRKTITFEETNAISSYLFAFAAGIFEKVTDQESGMTMYHREQDQEKVDRNASEIFALHRQSMEWLESYTGIEYPYSKFDFALIPPFQYGGMEHPGSVFYRESALFLDEGASINQQLRRASLIAHETAHMWFGNLVTMEWFNDVWLKEVFANQIASKIVHPEFPEVNHELNFLLSYYPGAMNVDRTSGSHPIQQSLQNLANAGTLYGNIIYNKAPIVMRNLEGILGKEAFRSALTKYLKTFYGGNATWDDLITIMDEYTEADLTQWNKDWVQGEGAPIYEVSINESDSLIYFKQQQKINNQIWPQQILYTTAFNSEQFNEIFLNQNEIQAPFIKGDFPAMVNIDGRGYGYFKILQPQWVEQFPVYGKSENEMTRAAFWLNTYEGVLNGDLKAKVVLEMLLDAIKREQNSLIIANNLQFLNRIFWQFLNPEEQTGKGREIEALLYSRILKEENTSIKRVLYNNLIEVTSTEQGGKALFDIWKSKGDLIDLKLSENDMVNLSYNIRLRQVAGSENILDLQLAEIANEDRKKRMRFVMPALSPMETE